MDEKKSFVMYTDYKQHLDLLPDEDKGKLFVAIINYADTQQIPENLNATALMAFSFIKSQMDRDNEKWKEKAAKRSAAGKQGMKSRWGDNKNNKDITSDNKNNNAIKDITKITVNGTVTGNGNGNVTVTDTVNGNDIPPCISPPKAKKEEPKKTYGEFKKVQLSETEYNKLVQRLGKDGLSDYIDRLDGWLAEGNKKKCHYATILNWWRKDHPKEGGVKSGGFKPSRT